MNIKEITSVISTLLSHWDLLFMWTSRSIKARYQQSVLGGLWAIIQPASTVAIFSIIFSVFLRIDTGGVPYVIFSYTAMVPWMFFASSISDMVESLVLNMNLVSKIYFPREILPIAALFARFFDFIIASIVLGVLLYYFHIQLSITAFIFLPAILLIQIFLALGIGLIGAGLNVFYRDIKHLFVLGLQIWFYASPIIYSITSVPERFRFVYFLNPMAGVIQSYRDVLLYQKLTGSGLIISLVSAVVVMIIGYWFFKRVEFQFADVV